MMKLQIKDAGAWRNLASFTERERDAVMKAAADLLRALAQPKTSMRVVDGDRLLFSCYSPTFLWSLP